MNDGIMAPAGRDLWRLLEAHNIDADSQFRRSGLDPSLINESRTRYPLELIYQAWVDAAVIIGNQNIGLEAAKHYSPLDIGALGVTFLSSATLMEALQRLERYISVINTKLSFSATEKDDRIDLISEITGLQGDANRIVEDCRMSIVVDLCRLGLNNEVDPIEVAFTYPEPNATGEHFGVFRCPLLFSQPVSRISFSLADSLHPFTAANREMALGNDQILTGMINDLKTSNLVGQVKRAIIDNLPSGTPSEELIAKQVFVSSRTLQRRLADESTNFRTLVLEVRRELAEQYIADRTMPLAEISYILGFSDTSSFSRAFKKWTGDSPALFRTNLP
jgi:AraC-like DNA-binding protein